MTHIPKEENRDLHVCHNHLHLLDSFFILSTMSLSDALGVNMGGRSTYDEDVTMEQAPAEEKTGTNAEEEQEDEEGEGDDVAESDSSIEPEDDPELLKDTQKGFIIDDEEVEEEEEDEEERRRRRKRRKHKHRRRALRISFYFGDIILTEF